MSGVFYRAIGGMVATDHGPLALGEARDLALLYARDAAVAEGPWRRLCAERARAMAGAANEASDWRRAAGWANPDEADRINFRTP